MRSVTGMFLNSDKSMLMVSGPRTSGSVWATSPNVNGAGCVKVDVLKGSEQESVEVGGLQAL